MAMLAPTRIKPLADVPTAEAPTAPAASAPAPTTAPAPTPAPVVSPTATESKPVPTAPAPVPATTQPQVAPLAPTIPVPNVTPLAPTGVALAPTITPTTTEMLWPGPTQSPVGGPPPSSEAQVAPATAPASLSQIDPGGSLIGTQIGPATDPRVARLQDMMMSGAERLGMTPYDQYLRQQAEALQSGPDRRQIALDTLKLFDEAQGEAQRLGTQQIGRDAARLGRLGSGMVTTDLGNLADRMDINRSRMMRELANETAGLEQSDRLARIGALQGLQEGEFGRGTSRVGTLADLQSILYGQGEAGRDELRGERAYQRQLANEARDSNLQELELANRLQNDEYSRMAPLWEMLSQIGWDGTDFDPTQIERARLLAQASGQGLGIAGQTGYATGGY